MAIYISMECQRERIDNEPEAKPKNEEFEIKFRRNPIYNLYAGSRCGRYININRKVISIGTRKRNGYLSCILRAEGGVKWKRYYIHRFIWECFNLG